MVLTDLANQSISIIIYLMFKISSFINRLLISILLVDFVSIFSNLHFISRIIQNTFIPIIIQNVFVIFNFPGFLLGLFTSLDVYTTTQNITIFTIYTFKDFLFWILICLLNLLFYLFVYHLIFRRKYTKSEL